MKISSRLSVVCVLVGLVLSRSSMAAEIEILQSDKGFRKTVGGELLKTITAKIGDVLKFVNKDTFTHNIFSISEKNEFELKIQKAGETSEMKLVAPAHNPGKMEVECAIHPGMKLIVDIIK